MVLGLLGIGLTCRLPTSPCVPGILPGVRHNPGQYRCYASSPYALIQLPDTPNIVAFSRDYGQQGVEHVSGLQNGGFPVPSGPRGAILSYLPCSHTSSQEPVAPPCPGSMGQKLQPSVVMVAVSIRARPVQMAALLRLTCSVIPGSQASPGSFQRWALMAFFTMVLQTKVPVRISFHVQFPRNENFPALLSRVAHRCAGSAPGPIIEGLPSDELPI